MRIAIGQCQRVVTALVQRLQCRRCTLEILLVGQRHGLCHVGLDRVDLGFDLRHSPCLGVPVKRHQTQMEQIERAFPVG